MPDARAPLYLDEDVSVILAAILRARGFDVELAVRVGRLLSRMTADDLVNQLFYV